MTNFYRILTVSQDATQNEIKNAYRRLCLALHPDKHMNDSEGELARCKVQFQAVQDAYDMLSDPEKRAMYDARLRSGSAIPPQEVYDHVHQVLIPLTASNITDLPELTGIYEMRDNLWNSVDVIQLCFSNGDQFFKAILKHIDFAEMIHIGDRKLQRFFTFLVMTEDPIVKLGAVLRAQNFRVDAWMDELIEGARRIIHNKEEFRTFLMVLDGEDFSSGFLYDPQKRFRTVIVALFQQHVHIAQDYYYLIEPLSTQATAVISNVLDNEFKPQTGKNGTLHLTIGDRTYHSDKGEFAVTTDGIFSVDFDDEKIPLQPVSATQFGGAFFGYNVNSPATEREQKEWSDLFRKLGS